jgi:GcrA cell cycle regulator
MPEFLKKPRWTPLARPQRPGDHWTEMRLNYIRHRWQQGATAERIARELGGITRASVLGKVRRLGLTRWRRRRTCLTALVRDRRKRALWRERAREPLRASPIGPALKCAPAAHTGDVRGATTTIPLPGGPAPFRGFLFPPLMQTVPHWVRDATPYVEDSDAGTDIPPTQRRSLLDLDSAVCRWPFGDPATAGFFFCGAPALTDRPYCPEHCAQAYVPVQPVARIALTPSVIPPAPGAPPFADRTGSNNGEEPR